MRYLCPNFLAFAVLSALVNMAVADMSSAQLAMEDSQNPLMLLKTSQGEIYLELFPAEAPNNVANFIALAEGEIEFKHSATGETLQSRYYSGMRFHRVIPDFIIQAGSPAYNPLGSQINLLADEINADSLGLNQISALNPDGSFAEMLNIQSKSDFHTVILEPLYTRRNINDNTAMLASQDETLAQLQRMSVKSVYENQGYRYNSSLSSRRIARGIVAMANSGPNSNGTEFFIALTDADWLTGRYTVIGKVVDGQDIIDTIGEIAIDPAQFSRLSTLIYSIHRAN